MNQQHSTGATGRRSSTSPPLASSSATTGSSGSRGYSPDQHYQVVAGQHPSTELDEISDSESHEYAYAYHNPIENVRSNPGVGAASSQDFCNIAYPRVNGYLRPFNTQQQHHNYNTKGSFDPQQPRSLASHLLPGNGSCFVERTMPTESPRIVIKCQQHVLSKRPNDNTGHSFGVDGDDEGDDSSNSDNGHIEMGSKDDHLDNESSLYAEAHHYSPHPVAYPQSYQ